MCCMELVLKRVLCTRLGSKGPLTDSLFIQRPDRHAMLMSPNKGETAVHGCHCQGDMTVRMRQVLDRRWVGMRVSLAVNSCLARFTD